MKIDGSRFTWGRSRPAKRSEPPRTWSLTDTCRAIGVIFLMLVPGQLLALEGAPATITSTLAAASAVGLFLLGEVFERGRWSEANSHGDDPVAFGIATLALVNGLTPVSYTHLTLPTILLV